MVGRPACRIAAHSRGTLTPSCSSDVADAPPANKRPRDRGSSVASSESATASIQWAALRRHLLTAPH